jgi:hypothetical protein
LTSAPVSLQQIACKRLTKSKSRLGLPTADVPAAGLDRN